tara:strand:+ start:8008 stop:9558 length:1551 start_codon:yes stop_codon:yes gene_type:complete
MKVSKEVKDYEGIKAFLIARVSDPRQVDALPAQELRLNEYSDRYKFNKELHRFDETAFKEDRAKFIEIVDEAIKYPKYFVMVFDKIDRLTRDVSSDVVRTLKNLVKEGRCELHFPSDGLIYHQHSPAHDKTRLDMGMVFGGYYSMAISDNVKRKIEQKLHDGEYPGKACIGYKNIKWEDANGKVLKNIIPDPDRKGYIVKAYDLRLEGKSYRTIAKILREEGFRSNTKKQGIVGQSQIETMLKNPFYYGVMRYDGGVYPHKYEPIIDKHTFDKVQLINDQRTNEKTKTNIKQVFTFSGLLKCATCGCSISSYEQKGHVYMRCTKAKVGVPCHQPHIAEADILPQVTKLLEKLSISEDIVNQVLDLMKNEHDNIQLFYKNAITQTRAEYQRLERKLSTLYEDRLDGRITVDDYDKYVMKYKSEMEDLDRKLVEYTNNDKSFNITSAYLLQLASKAKGIFESSQPEQKNKILRMLLANPTLNEKRLQLPLLKPFSVLIDTLESSNWLRRLDSNQWPSR